MLNHNLFGQLLVDLGIIGEEQLQRGLEVQRGTHPPKFLGEILCEQGLVDETSLEFALSVQKRDLEFGKVQETMSDVDLHERLRSREGIEFLRVARDVHATDLHLTSGAPPAMRMNGNLVDLPMPGLSREQCKKILYSFLSRAQIERFEKERSIDCGFEVDGVGRVRLNAFDHHEGLAGVFRLLPQEILSLDELGLPTSVKRLTSLQNGLVVVTGPTRSGKSTTLSAMIDRINVTRKAHVISIEDPIEIVHGMKRSLITQVEIPTDSDSFGRALRGALREDPDVIVVGEMRDTETVSTAITAAETGHLVLGTMHTANAPRTITRMLDQFTSARRPQIRSILANVLRAVVSQQLVPNADGRGVSLAAEVMHNNQAIANLIREDRAWQIPMVMQMNQSQGMRLMDDSLLELVRQRAITLEEGVARAIERDKFLCVA